MFHANLVCRLLVFVLVTITYVMITIDVDLTRSSYRYLDLASFVSRFS